MRLSESDRSQFYAALILGTGLARQGAGPFGLSCTCDIWNPCEDCRLRDERERDTFDKATAALVANAVVERG